MRPSNSDAPVVKSIALMGADAQAAQIQLAVPGLAGQPRVEVLTNPHRVVIDLPGVLRGTLVGRKDLQSLSHPLVVKARLAQFAEAPNAITRLVLEVVPGTQVAVHAAGTGLTLDLSAGKGTVQARMEGSAPQAVMPVAAPAPKVETEVVTAKAAPAPSLPGLPAIGTGFSVLPRLAATTLVPAASPEALQDAKPSPAPARAPGPKAPNASRTLGDLAPAIRAPR